MGLFDFLGSKPTPQATIDPALKAQLQQRGMTEKIKELETPIPLTPLDAANQNTQQIKQSLRDFSQRPEVQDIKLAGQDLMKKVGTLTQVSQGLANPTLGMVNLARTKTGEKVIKELGGTIARAPQRALTSVALDFPTQIYQAKTGKKTPAIYQPKGKVEQFFFGKEPIKSAFTRVEELQAQGQEYLRQKGVPLPESQGISLAVSPLLVGAAIGLDLSPIGGAERQGEKLLAEKYGSIIAKKIISFGDEAIQAALRTDADNILPKLGIELRAGNIRLDKFLAPAEVKDLLVQVSETLPPETFTPQKTAEFLRGVADKVGVNPQTLVDKFQRQGILNATDLAVLDNALNVQSKKVLELERLYLANPIDVNVALALAEEKSLLGSLLATATGGRQESGRAVNQFRNIRQALEKSPEELNLRTVQDLLGEDFIKWTEEFSKIDLNDPLQVRQFLAKSQEATFWDKVVEWRTAGLLAKPATQVANLIGNTLFSTLQPAIKGMAAIQDLGASVLGRPREVFFGEVAADIIGKTRGLQQVGRQSKQAVEEVANAFRTAGTFKAGVSAGLKTMMNILDNVNLGRLELEQIRPNAIKGKLGQFIRLPFYGLSLGDEFGRIVNMSGEVYSQAYAQAAKAGGSLRDIVKRTSEIIANPIENQKVFSNAAKRANELLFRGEGSAFEKALLRARDGLGPAGKLIVPFLKTPIQIAREGIGSTPFGYLRALRSTDPRMASLWGAQASIGALIMATAALYAHEGALTGRAPKNADEADAFYRSGKKPYSFKVGDKWISYNRFEPLSFPISIIADAAQTYKESGTAPDQGIIGPAFISIVNNLTSKTYLKSISDFFDALQDPEASGKKFVSQFASSFVPSPVASVAKAIDPTIRKPEGVVQTVFSKIPGLSKLVPARRNVYGEQVTWFENPDAFIANAFKDLFNPVSISKERIDLMDKVLEQYDLTIGFPNKTQLGVKLDQKAYNRFIERSGNLIRDLLYDVVISPQFAQLDQTMKEKLVKTFVSRARDQFQKQLVVESLMREFDLPLVSDPVILDLFGQAVDSAKFKALEKEQQKEIMQTLLDRALIIYSEP